jgi:hypothetical protein
MRRSTLSFHHHKEDRSGRDSTRPSDRSNTYTLCRLARDNPELLDRIEAGEASED